MSYTLSSGVSGILWAFSHVNNLNSVKVNLSDIIGDEMNDFLFQCSKKDISRHVYDYLHGGISVLLYFLERVEEEKCRKIIEQLLIEIEKTSENFPEGISWMEGFHFVSKNEKRYNLGLAHGMPSIIVLLSRVLEKNIASTVTKKLLDGAIKWVLAQKRGEGGNGLFPSTIPSTSPYFGRVSWCYGDLGIAIAILQAAIISNNDSWKEQAVEIGLNTAKRVQPEAGSIDTCFCHGTSGNAHIFNRLYHYTGIMDFKNAAFYWYMQTLQIYKANGHFKYFMRDEDGGNPRWEDRAGILEGISGIGLVLLSAITDIEPKWDRCFLLS